MDMSLLREFVVIALLCTVVIYACNKAKIPPIVGFLITGAMFGPYSLGLVDDISAVETMSEIGVVFLLFSIGMELSLAELIRLKKPVLLGGSGQVAGCLLAFLGLGLWKGDTLESSAFIGCLLALSSTAIVLNVFQAKGQSDSPAGRISLAMLIFQDLVSVPMVLAIPLLAGQQEVDPLSLALAAARTVAAIGGAFLLARKLVPLLLTFIVRTRNRELFLICVIGICLGTAYVTGLMGFSLALGAFLAGLVISESEYSHSAMEGVMPFKDIFTSLFFVSVGMLMDVHYFIEHMGHILAVTLIILLLKALITGGVSLALGYPLKIAVITGLALCQVGEFSFVLAKSGMKYDLLTSDEYQVFLAASILTMSATPFLMAGAPRIAARIDSLVSRRAAAPEKCKPPKGLQDHLIIIGFGPTGQLLARSAKEADIPYVVLEMNPDTVKRFRAMGEPIQFGDASRAADLERLGARKARILAIVVSDPKAVASVTRVARGLNKDLYIMARVRYMTEMPELLKGGANEVIPEEFETSVEILARVMSRYLVPKESIDKFVSQARSETYPLQRKLAIPGMAFDALHQGRADLGVFALTVCAGSWIEGKSLTQSRLRDKAKVTVMAVSRGKNIVYNPPADFAFKAGDSVYVFAVGQDAEQAESYFTV